MVLSMQANRKFSLKNVQVVLCGPLFFLLPCVLWGDEEDSVRSASLNKFKVIHQVKVKTIFLNSNFKLRIALNIGEWGRKLYNLEGIFKCWRRTCF